MNITDRREGNSEAILKGRFINDQLLEESKDMDQEQVGLLSRRGFDSREWYDDRSYSVLDNRMKYDHTKRHRFVDMKTRNTKSGKIRKKSHPIHNRFIFGHFNNIIKRLHFGFTTAVREQLANREF